VWAYYEEAPILTNPDKVMDDLGALFRGTRCENRHVDDRNCEFRIVGIGFVIGVDVEGICRRDSV
jgi:hypothetical protein